jgi:hypothetical protein
MRRGDPESNIGGDRRTAQSVLLIIWNASDPGMAATADNGGLLYPIDKPSQK